VTNHNPYPEIDPPVRNLIRVLNQFPGVKTYTSCGGHAEVENSCQMSEGTWYVDFNVDRSDEGWMSLEFFAWVAYDGMDSGVILESFAKPPWLNRPGGMLFFRWAGVDAADPHCSADSFAERLATFRESFYVTAAEAESWEDV
jgi:hypothetical protein